MTWSIHGASRRDGIAAPGERIMLFGLTVGSVVAVAGRAWANAPDPELYPEEAAAYGDMVTRTILLTCGVLGFVALLVALGITLLVVWLVRRKRAAGPPPGAG